MQTRSKKRKSDTLQQDEKSLTDEFFRSCEKNFDSNPTNMIVRNSVNSVGSMFSGVDSVAANSLSHNFTVSVKRKHLKATNQGSSGRCWMFAALNTFRHFLINALNLESFEFSEVYLFFWDKMERSNTYLLWFMNNPQEHPGTRAADYMLMDYMGDGGWWNTFANLVTKYGLLPSGVMKETYQSGDSADMNKIIKEQLNSAVNEIRKYACASPSPTGAEKVRQQTLSNIYDTLVKFLGKPPQSFNWFFNRQDGMEDSSSTIVEKLDPYKFLHMVTAGSLNIREDFVVLAHIPTPGLKYYQSYRIKCTNNVHEGDLCTVFNVPIQELSKYAMKSIQHGVAVWFAGDVMQSFNWFHSALDDKLDAQHTLFQQPYEFNKSDRIVMRSIQTNHAMALTGFNANEKGKSVNWQVENSWGYWDNETPGLDGFLTMSHSWFEKYVTEVVICKKFFTKKFLQQVESSIPNEIEPWDAMAPALRTGGFGVPMGYQFAH